MVQPGGPAKAADYYAASHTQESAMPGLNWAVGLDALRVLEWADEERLDWLLSVEADEIDDIMERIKCGVHGSRFQACTASTLHTAPTLRPHCAHTAPPLRLHGSFALAEHLARRAARRG